VSCGLAIVVVAAFFLEQSRNFTKRGELFHTPHLAEQSLMYVNFLCFADEPRDLGGLPRCLGSRFFLWR